MTTTTMTTMTMDEEENDDDGNKMRQPTNKIPESDMIETNIVLVTIGIISNKQPNQKKEYISREQKERKKDRDIYRTSRSCISVCNCHHWKIEKKKQDSKRK